MGGLLLLFSVFCCNLNLYLSNLLSTQNCFFFTFYTRHVLAIADATDRMLRRKVRKRNVFVQNVAKMCFGMEWEFLGKKMGRKCYEELFI